MSRKTRPRTPVLSSVPLSLIFTGLGLILVFVAWLLADEYRWSILAAEIALVSFILSLAPRSWSANLIASFVGAGSLLLKHTGAEVVREPTRPAERTGPVSRLIGCAGKIIGAFAIVVALANSLLYSYLGSGSSLRDLPPGLIYASYETASPNCAAQLRFGTRWSDHYEQGSKRFPFAPAYYISVWGSLIPKSDGATAYGYVFGKAWYIFWTRWGEVKVDLSLAVSCEGECGVKRKKCIADASTRGISQREDGIVKALFASKAAPSDDNAEWVAELSGSLGASGGPSGQIGVVNISWPDATAQTTFQAGTFKWMCECRR